MTTQESKQPNFLDIDLEQWRRDIRTFSQTTQHALEAIVSELSNRCSSGHAPGDPETSRPARRPAAKVPAEPTTAPVKRELDSSVPPADDEDRLAQLKLKLAQRIAQSS